MSYFFTSDLHFGHSRVLEYCRRPFSSVDHMNEVLIERWNSVVTDRDIVYVVGDFALCRPELATQFARRLRGHKHIVWGNHDKQTRKNADFLAQFESHHDLVTVKIPDLEAKDGKSQRITLCHFAMKVWDKSHHGAWHLYGHSHGSMPEDPHSLSFDVGVDVWDFRPVSYEAVKAKMATKTWRAVDGHTGD